MTKHIRLSNDESAQWHDPDGAARDNARRLIRADARHAMREVDADRVEISDDAGIVVEAIERDVS